MRVLITVDPEIPVPPRTYGGIERIVHALVRGLRVRGHHIGLIAHRDSSCEVDAFYPWPGRQSQNRIDSIHNMYLLRRVASSFKPHVLHSFSRILYMLMLMRNRLPKVMTF